MVMREVSDDSPLNRTLLTSVMFWVQVYDVPVLRQTEYVSRFMGNLLSTVVSVDLGPGRNRYSYLRIMVEVDIRGALPKGTTLVLNRKDMPVKFKYERLFAFCFWCGLLDHVIDDCEDFFDKGQRFKDCGYDESMRVVPPRQGYGSTQAVRAPQIAPRPLLTNDAMSRYGMSSNFFGSSGLVAPPGFLPVPQLTTVSQQVSLTPGSSLGLAPGQVDFSSILQPPLALPAPKSTMALLQQVSMQCPTSNSESTSSVVPSIIQGGGHSSYDRSTSTSRMAGPSRVPTWCN